MSEEPTSKPKIIVDDDWKSRAQAEKEQLQRETAGNQKQQPDMPPSTEPTSTEPASSSSEPDSGEPLPTASFSVLVTSLATQAVAMMGQIPGEDGQPIVQLDHAKHFIDTLGVLEDKTKGNLTPDESALLTNVLHELRLLFITVGKQAKAKDSSK